MTDFLFSPKFELQRDILLKNEAFQKFESETFDSDSFSSVRFGDNCAFSLCVFTDCTFEDCSFDRYSFFQASFIGCKFIRCTVLNSPSQQEQSVVTAYGCDDYNTGFLTAFAVRKTTDQSQEAEINYKGLILEKLFRVDRKTPRMKLISTIKTELEKSNKLVAFEAFNKLKSSGLIVTNGNNAHITQDGIAYFNEKFRAHNE